jgi:two-component system CheB/CheR fusion protein
MRQAILVEGEVQDRSDRWHRLQLRPHRALDGRVDGAILSLTDVDDLRLQVMNAQWARDYARNIVEAIQVPLVVLDAGLCVLSANAAYYRVFQERPDQTEGQSFFELGAGEWNTSELQRAVVAVHGDESRFQGLVVERGVEGNGRCTTTVSGCAVPSPAGVNLVLLSMEVAP